MSEEPIPAAIDRYEILRKLATGGMAELFLAKQSGLEGFEKVVVIKRILSHLAQDDEFVSMFLDEARIAAKLSHPNIVQIYDLGKADDSYYIAMEYVSGRNVQHVLGKQEEKGTHIPVEHTCRMVAGVCDGLHYAHSRKDYDGQPLNIVHRDISPQNILVSFAGGVKVVDFGIAKASTQLAQTRAGVLKGKYAYMSPEQVRGQKVDHRSDIFALGLVMYEMLTGRRPFERESSLKTLKAIVQDKPLNPREVNPDIPIEVVKLLSRALEKNPDRRYKNAQEMQLALEDYLESSPKKSNNVRLSRYLYELFDDELNSESGTMVVQGIGEVIIPTGVSRSKRKPELEDEEIDSKTLSAVLAPEPPGQARDGGPEPTESSGPARRANEPGVRVVREDKESAAGETSGEELFEGTKVNAGPPASMQGDARLEPEQLDAEDLEDSEEEEPEDKTIPVYSMEEYEKERDRRDPALGRGGEEEFPSDDETVGGLPPVGGGHSGPTASADAGGSSRDGPDRDRAAAMLAKVEAMAAGFEDAISSPGANTIPPPSSAPGEDAVGSKEWEGSTQQGAKGDLAPGALHSDEAVVGPSGVVRTGSSGAVRPSAAPGDIRPAARPGAGSSGRSRPSEDPTPVAQPAEASSAPLPMAEPTPETSRRPVPARGGGLPTPVLLAFGAIGVMLFLTVGALVLLFALDGDGQQGVAKGAPRILQLDTAPTGMELRYNGVSYRTPATLIVEQGSTATVEIVREGGSASYNVQVPLGAEPVKKTIALED